MTKQLTLSVNSMTAFARVQGDNALGSYAWELRSVNHRYLEAQFKLPDKLKVLEPILREKMRGAIARGKIECSLYFKANESEQSFIVNEEKITALLSAAQQLEALDEKKSNIVPLTSYEILQWPGVLQSVELNIDAVTDSLLESFNDALLKLAEARASEGKRMADVICEKLDQVDDLTHQVKLNMPKILAEHQQRLEERLAQLKADVDQDRLAQEVVMLAQKVDVAEELDRLLAHTAEVRDTLVKNEPCGRRLDFLMQELNREANTLGSKSIATDSSQGAINLKVLIEQMREQVQNIE
ncbi:MAG: YicC family protein [Pseudomonadales bacterium]|nr:YicC family protein [Pseudomonadales bacterium]